MRGERGKAIVAKGSCRDISEVKRGDLILLSFMVKEE